MTHGRKKTGKTRRDTAVQGTNDSSSVSKASTAAHLYVNDDYVRHFVAKTARRSPLIHWGYYIRSQAVDHVLKRFISTFSTGPKQIVNIGAGFDSMFFRLKSQGYLQNVTIFEIDFEDVMRRKLALINNNPALKSLLSPADEDRSSPNIIFQSKDLCLLAVDLRDVSQLERLCDVTALDRSLPTLLLSEVAITYMAPQHSSAVVCWAAHTFTDAVFASYEQILPNDPFGIFMCSHFRAVGSPLRTIEQHATLSSHAQNYRDQGWTEASAVNMNSFYEQCVSREERERVMKLEAFDEYEEWHLMCGHYMMVVGGRGRGVGLVRRLWSMDAGGKEGNEGKDGWEVGDVVKKRGCNMASGTECNKDIRVDSAPCNADVRGECEVDIREEFNVDAKEECDMDLSEECKVDTREECNMATGSKIPTATCAKCETVSNSDCCIDFLPERLQAKRFAHASSLITIGNKKYCATIGGFGEFKGQHCRMKSIHLLDLETRTSHTIDHATLLRDVILHRLHHTITPTNNDTVLIYGGRLSPVNPCASVVRVRFFQDTDCHGNDVLQCSAETVQCDNLPLPRWRHTVTPCRNKQGRPQLLVCGGLSWSSESQQRTVLSDCHLLDIDSSTWHQPSTSGASPGPRHSHSADTWRGQCVISCGLDPEMRPLNSIHMLDTDKWEWCQLECNPPITPRYSHSSAVVSDNLYLVGGVSTSPHLATITAIHLPTGGHTDFTLPVSGSMLHCLSSVLISQHTLLIMGGGGNCFSFGTHFNKQPYLISLPTPH